MKYSDSSQVVSKIYVFNLNPKPLKQLQNIYTNVGFVNQSSSLWHAEKQASCIHDWMNEWSGTTSAWWDAVSANRCSSDLHFCRALEQVYVGVATLACGNFSLPACSSCSTIDSISAAGRQAGRQACRRGHTCVLVKLVHWIPSRCTTQSKTIIIYIYIHILFHILTVPISAYSCRSFAPPIWQ
jgi:hypothetical protein